LQTQYKRSSICLSADDAADGIWEFEHFRIWHMTTWANTCVARVEPVRQFWVWRKLHHAGYERRHVSVLKASARSASGCGLSVMGNLR
jgi:hypothetical protein